MRKLEAQWATGLGSQLKTEDGGDNAVDLFKWGQQLSVAWATMGGLEPWLRLRHEVIAPYLGKTSAALLSSLPPDAKEAFAKWWTSYGTAMHEAFEAIEQNLRSQRADAAQSLAKALDPHLPQPWRSLPLSRKAVLTLLTAPVSCVLVGMRRPGYVHDILALRDHPVRLLSAATGPVDLEAVNASLAQMTLS